MRFLYKFIVVGVVGFLLLNNALGTIRLSHDVDKELVGAQKEQSKVMPASKKPAYAAIAAGAILATVVGGGFLTFALLRYRSAQAKKKSNDNSNSNTSATDTGEPVANDEDSKALEGKPVDDSGEIRAVDTIEGENVAEERELSEATPAEETVDEDKQANPMTPPVVENLASVANHGPLNIAPEEAAWMPSACSYQALTFAAWLDIRRSIDGGAQGINAVYMHENASSGDIDKINAYHDLQHAVKYGDFIKSTVLANVKNDTILDVASKVEQLRQFDLLSRDYSALELADKVIVQKMRGYLPKNAIVTPLHIITIDYKMSGELYKTNQGIFTKHQLDEYAMKNYSLPANEQPVIEKTSIPAILQDQEFKQFYDAYYARP